VCICECCQHLMYCCSSTASLKVNNNWLDLGVCAQISSELTWVPQSGILWGVLEAVLRFGRFSQLPVSSVVLIATYSFNSPFRLYTVNAENSYYRTVRVHLYVKIWSLYITFHFHLLFMLGPNGKLRSLEGMGK